MKQSALIMFDEENTNHSSKPKYRSLAHEKEFADPSENNKIEEVELEDADSGR